MNCEAENSNSHTKEETKALMDLKADANIMYNKNGVSDGSVKSETVDVVEDYMVANECEVPESILTNSPDVPRKSKFRVTKNARKRPNGLDWNPSTTARNYALAEYYVAKKKYLSVQLNNILLLNENLKLQNVNLELQYDKLKLQNDKLKLQNDELKLELEKKKQLKGEAKLE